MTLSRSFRPRPPRQRGGNRGWRIVSGFCTAATVIVLAACSKVPAEKEPTVAVQAETAEKKTLHQTISAQAILFPLQQAAITPKISAPVSKFLVNRGNPVRAGQLLAVLENRDLM